MITVVVGHGRSPEGQHWGRYIDRKVDVVIRMWDNAWQKERDYGTKYDYGLFELYPSTFANFKQHNHRKPSKGWIGSKLFGWERVTPPPRTDAIDQKRWTRIGTVMGGVGQTGKLELTRGTIAACWAIEQSEAFSVVILVGFDNVRLGYAKPLEEAFSPEYMANPGTYPFDKYVGGGSKYGNHDYAVEYPLMKALAKLYAVDVVFAEEYWGHQPAVTNQGAHLNGLDQALPG